MNRALEITDTEAYKSQDAVSSIDTYQEQCRLEAESRLLGIDRFHNIHNSALERGHFGETTVGRQILGKLVGPFVDLIEKYVEETTPRHIAHRMLKDFDDNHAAAYLFVKSVLNLIPKRFQQTEINGQKHMGAKANLFWAQSTDGIHDELVLRHFAENEPKIMKNIVRQCDIRALTRDRRRMLYQKTLREQQMEWVMPGWEKPNRVQLGTVLYHLFVEATNGIEQRVVNVGRNKQERLLCITEEFQKTIELMLKNGEEMFGLYYPMVHPPNPWQNDGLIGSAYLTDNIRPYKVIKRAPLPYLRDMELTDLSIPLNALNAVQATPWRINSHMLEALSVAYEEDYGVDPLPPANNLELPPYNTTAEKGSKEWKQAVADAAMVHRLNRKAVNKRIALLNVLSLARKFSAYERIYFPHEMDSRGRMYPKPTFLNPQGQPHVRALLEFAEGRAIENEEHVAYLAIAGANAFGHDKLPLDQRIDWAYDNEEMFISIATDWRNDRRWVQADDPFGFLRFCMEWKGLADHGPGFISHMPVNLDATCSGLQHFSAILKDQVGGFHVNLTSDATRQDIYQAVADRATQTLQKEIDEGEHTYWARIAMRVGITRSLAKRPVMIVPYAGTFKACMGYVEAYYLELYEKEVSQFGGITEGDIIRSLAPLVAKHVWAAIGDTVIAARGAMDWITSVSRLITKGSHKDDPIMWITPAGFTVRQHNLSFAVHDVWTYMHGKMRVRLRDETDQVDARRTAQAISPNYIHSMDAAHLQLTVDKAVTERPGTSFAMIHDSFGTHAADIGFLLNECIKPTFHAMYANTNQLEAFYEQIKPMIDDLEKVPPMPLEGTLDLDDVLHSNFFFS